MEGQMTLFDYIQEPYFYVVEKNGKWKKPCDMCANWNFSIKGARCTFIECYENGCKDFKDMRCKK